jgi:hypothetical protein
MLKQRRQLRGWWAVDQRFQYSCRRAQGHSQLRTCRSVDFLTLSGILAFG